MNKYLSIFLRAIGTIIVTFIFSHLLDIVVRILTNVFVGLVPPLLHSIFSFDLGTALNATLINQATGIGTAGSLALVDFDAYSPRLLMLGLIFGTLIAIVIFTLIIGLLARLVKGNRVFYRIHCCILMHRIYKRHLRFLLYRHLQSFHISHSRKGLVLLFPHHPRHDYFVYRLCWRCRCLLHAIQRRISFMQTRIPIASFSQGCNGESMTPDNYPVALFPCLTI